jgi:excinuclease ABC subunit C
MNEEESLKQKLQTLPNKPGVYLMKNEAGRIIYVGKAVDLSHRVRSYFYASASQTPKIKRLVANIYDLEFIVTDSELEALILEANLIKKNRPRYNVRLKDDKRYPYIRIRWAEDFPRIDITRQMHHDGSRYFGPYTASWAVAQTLDLLRRLFPYRTCDREITGHDERPCLYYHIKRCSGPCIGAISREDYRATIDRICLFLEGKTEDVVRQLNARMETSAESLEFEEAARYRDQLHAIERVVENQKVVSKRLKNQDVVAFARANGEACVQVFFIRYGKLIGREYFVLEGTADEDAQNIMASFLTQFYNEAAYIPPEILLPEQIDEVMIIQSWLKSKRGKKVSLLVPHRGQNKDLVQMATENAVETLNHLKAQWLIEEGRSVEALKQIQDALNLPGPPSRIECYDISNLQGTAATGSMVVFVKGVPRKSDYRRFKIRTIEGPDDYAMLKEVLCRRLERLADDSEELPARAKNKEPSAWTLKPDLMIIDGGKGQLNAVLETMQEHHVEDIPVAGLAKTREELFLPGNSEPIMLPEGSQGLFLIQRIRDEAHRFAVEYHRKLRSKSATTSTLEDVPGIGPRRRQALIKHFGSIDAIAEAGIEELASVSGMTRQAAEKVKEYL